jgi:hypothetical protein
MFILTGNLIAFVLFARVLMATKPVPLATRLSKADVIVVATIKSARRIPDADPRSHVAAVEPFLGLPLYVCELVLRVDAPIKGGKHLSQGSELVFVWRLPSPACSADRWGDSTALQKPALWLLRQLQNAFYALEDNSSTVIPLRSFPPLVEHSLAEWSKPGLALTYLLLKPGVLIPEKEISKSTEQWELIAIGGWRDFLAAYRKVYLESSEETRGQIALSVSVIGQCLNLARRTATAEGHLAELEATVELNGTRDEPQANRMFWSSREEVLKAFETSKEALDHLTLKACGTAPKTRQRAREILNRYFDVDLATLPCIPCETQ